LLNTLGLSAFPVVLSVSGLPSFPLIVMPRFNLGTFPQRHYSSSANVVPTTLSHDGPVLLKDRPVMRKRENEQCFRSLGSYMIKILIDA
jgi:hypothetical protein